MIMNKLSIYTLKALKKSYAKIFPVQPVSKPDCEQNPSVSSQLIYDHLISDNPCMIARFGSTELMTMVNYLGVKDGEKNIIKYIQGKKLDWWWNPGSLHQMQQWSGFFPPTVEKIATIKVFFKYVAKVILACETVE